MPNPHFPRPHWRFPSFLVDNEDFRHTLYEAWAEYASTNGAHIKDPNLFWEVDKAFLRGKIISYTTQFKKHSRQQYMQASNALRLSHERLTLNRAPDNIQTWQQSKCSFDTWADQQEAAKSYSALHFHRFGNKAGKLLAKLCSGPRRPTHISALINTAGSPAEIGKLLADYYTTLYSKHTTDQMTAEAFLAKTHVPKLNSTQLETLNAPISLEGSQLTIKSEASAKAPGPDGYTAKFYKLTKDFIPDTMKHVFTTMWDGSPYLPTEYRHTLD